MKTFYDQKAVLKAMWLGAKSDEQLSLLRELVHFRQMIREIIVLCKISSQFDENRVYIPRHKCWYRTECLKKGVIPSLRILKK